MSVPVRVNSFRKWYSIVLLKAHNTWNCISRQRERRVESWVVLLMIELKQSWMEIVFTRVSQFDSVVMWLVQLVSQFVDEAESRRGGEVTITLIHVLYVIKMTKCNPIPCRSKPLLTRCPSWQFRFLPTDEVQQEELHQSHASKILPLSFRREAHFNLSKLWWTRHSLNTATRPTDTIAPTMGSSSSDDDVDVEKVTVTEETSDNDEEHKDDVKKDKKKHSKKVRSI